MRNDTMVFHLLFIYLFIYKVKMSSVGLRTNSMSVTKAHFNLQDTWCLCKSIISDITDDIKLYMQRLEMQIKKKNNENDFYSVYCGCFCVKCISTWEYTERVPRDCVQCRREKKRRKWTGVKQAEIHFTLHYSTLSRSMPENGKWTNRKSGRTWSVWNGIICTDAVVGVCLCLAENSQDLQAEK